MGHWGNVGKMAAILPLGDDTVSKLLSKMLFKPHHFPTALGDNPMIDKISSKQDQTLRITSAKEREDGLCRTPRQVRWSDGPR